MGRARPRRKEGYAISETHVHESLLPDVIHVILTVPLTEGLVYANLSKLVYTNPCGWRDCAEPGDRKMEVIFR